jgi:hypothetical protein
VIKAKKLALQFVVSVGKRKDLACFGFLELEVTRLAVVFGPHLANQISLQMNMILHPFMAKYRKARIAIGCGKGVADEESEGDGGNDENE